MVDIPVLARVRDAIASDIPTVAALERAAFTDPWSPRMFTVCLQSDVHLLLVAERADHQVIGFAVVQIVRAEAELLDIAVAEEERGRGVGRTLLDTVLTRCAKLAVSDITLEVRESNVAARALYASRGFNIVGRRRRYYTSPVEDGLILKAEIPVSTGIRGNVQHNADA